MPTIPRILVRCLSLVILAWGVPASAQVRIRSEVLSPGVRDAIRRGAVVKQSPNSAATDTLSRTTSEVTLSRNQVLMAKSRAPYLERTVEAAQPAAGDPPAPRGQDSVYNLGVEFVGVEAGTSRPVNYKPVFIRHGAAYFQPDANSYQAHFSVAVIDASGAAGYELATPLTMTFGGDPEAYDPPNVVVRRPGDAPARVKLSSRRGRDSVSIRIFMGSDTEGVPFSIPVDQPKLQLAGPEKIQGFGVDFAKYQVRTTASNGPSTHVGLVTTRGSLDKDAVQLGPSGSGSFVLKSGGGLDTAYLTASAINMGDGTFPVVFVPPYMFFGFVLAGGIAGALYAESQAKKRLRTRKGIGRFWGAVLGGVIATAVYVGLGINLLALVVSAPLASEIAVFAFAALGAAFGLKLAAGGEPAST